MCSLIGTDITGPLKSTEGYKYIVTVIDYTTKFVRDETVMEKTSETVAKFFNNYYADIPDAVYILQTEEGSSSFHYRWVFQYNWFLLLYNFNLSSTS